MVTILAEQLSAQGQNQHTIIYHHWLISNMNIYHYWATLGFFIVYYHNICTTIYYLMEYLLMKKLMGCKYIINSKQEHTIINKSNKDSNSIQNYHIRNTWRNGMYIVHSLSYNYFIGDHPKMLKSYVTLGSHYLNVKIILITIMYTVHSLSSNY